MLPGLYVSAALHRKMYVNLNELSLDFLIYLLFWLARPFVFSKTSEKQFLRHLKLPTTFYPWHFRVGTVSQKPILLQHINIVSLCSSRTTSVRPFLRRNIFPRGSAEWPALDLMANQPATLILRASWVRRWPCPGLQPISRTVFRSLAAVASPTNKFRRGIFVIWKFDFPGFRRGSTARR